MIFFLYILVSFCSAKLTFKSTRSFLLDGRTYTETLEQPWFRNIHDPHLAIPNAMVNETNFGKHVLPEDDVFVPHDWPPDERKYLPCRNLTCVCPFYQGKVSGQKCILPNGKPLLKAIRKEIRTLTEKERNQIHNAFLRMKADGIYDRIGFVHKYSGVHEGPGFYTWHREFLKRAELLLRKYLPEGSSLGIPYWDSTLEAYLPESSDSTFFSEHFVGETDENDLVSTGPYRDWLTMEGTRRIQRFVGKKDNGEVISDARIDYVMSLTNISRVLAPVVSLESCKIWVRDERILEYSHDFVHDYINGDMKEAYSSSSEIIFFFHHTFIDSLWEMWRQKHQNRHQRETEYPPDLDDCWPEKHFIDHKMKELDPYTNRDVLSNDYTDYMYSYAPRPTCISKDSECGSEFLFCYTEDVYPKCMAKVRLGGQCFGYDHFAACFDGVCVQGKCQPRILRQAQPEMLPSM